MVECMQEHVLTKTRLIIQSPKFLFMFVDEITTMDCQRWIFVHVYVVLFMCMWLKVGSTYLFC
jgi:hypothetical protein